MALWAGTKEKAGNTKHPTKLILDGFLVLSQRWVDGLCATGSASAPHLQEALAEPVAHINTRLTDR